MGVTLYVNSATAHYITLECSVSSFADISSSKPCTNISVYDPAKTKYYLLEYNIQVLNIEMTGRKPWRIRVQITAVTSKSYFMVVLCVLYSKTLKVQMKCFFLFPNLKEQQKSGRSPFTVS